jgi:flagellar biogenesis protein FliO
MRHALVFGFLVLTHAVSGQATPSTPGTLIQPMANSSVRGDPAIGGSGDLFQAAAATEGTDPLIRVALILLILALGAGGLWWWKRKGPSTGIAGLKRDARLQILETRMLGNRQFLLVADYDGRRMLLGVGPGLINHLCDLPEGVAPPESFAIPKAEEATP